MSYSIYQIIKIIGAESPNDLIRETEITQLLFDSRKISLPGGALFFALQGLRSDGHDYISNAYQKGVRYFVVNRVEEEWQTNCSDAYFFKVENTLTALQNLSIQHRKNFDLPVIAITGSNGKTIIKEWLYELMRAERNIVRSPKSYNSQIGVPLSVWQINKQHELGIFEAGISRKGEMKKLADITRPKIGLLTNIGEAHSEGFSSQEEKLQEKLKLFENCELLIYRSDNGIIDKAVHRLPNVKKLFWSTEKSANLQIISISKAEGQTTLKALYRPLAQPHKAQAIEIEAPFTDDAYLENIVHCWLLMLYWGYDNTIIAKRIKTLKTVPLRLELKAALNNCTLINDSYSNDLSSLLIALDFLEQQRGSQPATLILSDIQQSKLSSEELYRYVAELIQKKKINRLIGVGEEVSNIKKYLQNIDYRFFSTTEALKKVIPDIDFNHESILLKGARSFGFERIADLLERQAHRTILEINLNALIHNLNVFSRFLEPETKVMAMVKAAAYGSGSDEVARLLEFKQVDYLAVAYIDEGVELRQAGIHLPILVLNPEEAGFEAMLRHQLEPEIYGFDILDKLLKYLERYLSGYTLPIHLNLNTGMNRLGFEIDDLAKLGQVLQANNNLKINSIFSHLAASDETGHDEFTLQQIEQFKQMYEQLVEGLSYRPMRHILNSAGICRFPEHQMDMVRLGIGLYGIGATDIQEELETVSTLKATISQIKDIAKGETIGYGRIGKAERPMRIATISIGYADGYLRQLSQGKGSVVIHGKMAPTIGNVCMDMCMVDITEIPTAREGDEVIIFGKEKPVQDLAKELHTIPYEVFTNISSRVKRVYFQE